MIVTIYGNDTIATEPCSATVLQFANVAQCYNASWVYYSIDGCSIPSSSSESASSSSSSSSVNAGAIAGGVIGALAGIGILAGLFWYFCVSRSKGENPEAPVPSQPPTFEKPAYVEHPRPPQELAAPYFETTSNKMSYELQAARESARNNRLYAELPTSSK